MLTNRMNLPEGIVRAVTNDPYTRGDSDISVTQLIQPPYQARLKRTIPSQEDVSERIWSLIGQATHSILERAYPVSDENLTPQQHLQEYGYVTERRLYTQVSGWSVSGQFDAVEGSTLYDYKITSVWSVMGEAKDEWTQQLNLLRLLLIRNRIEIRNLRIIAILRDWSKMKSLQPDYPSVQVVPIEIPVWTVKQAEQYLEERVRLHQEPSPPPCTPEERWQTTTKWALMKAGRKSAVKLYETQQEGHAALIQAGKGHTLLERPGQFRRCADYCPVAHGCPTYQEEVAF